MHTICSLFTRAPPPQPVFWEHYKTGLERSDFYRQMSINVGFTGRTQPYEKISSYTEMLTIGRGKCGLENFRYHYTLPATLYRFPQL